MRAWASGLATSSIESSLRKGGRSSRYSVVPVTFARALSCGTRLPTQDACPGIDPAAHLFANGGLLAHGAGDFMVEFQQDILGKLQAILAAAADVGDRLDLGPRPLARLRGRSTRRRSVRPGSSRSAAASSAVGPTPEKATAAERIRPPRCFDPDGRTKGRCVDLLALGDLVELDQFVRAGQWNDDPRDDFVRCQSTSASAPGGSLRPSRAGETAGAGHFELGPRDQEKAQRIGHGRAVGDVSRPACRRCGSEASQIAA